MLHPMGDMLKLIGWAVIGLSRSRASLEAEILTLRHQLNVLRRKSPKRFTFSNLDRLIFTSLYRLAPRVVNALVIVKPETVIRWQPGSTFADHALVLGALRIGEGSIARHCDEL
jgi:hypothetical protein